VPAPIGITCGDVSGIGPELVDHLWINRHALGLDNFMVIGPRHCFAHDVGDTLIDIKQHGVSTLGQPGPSSAMVARDALEMAAALALSGKISAVVTAPVNKASLYKIGFTYPGQTEFFADRCNVASEKTVMMLAGPELRTVPLTIHVPLADVVTKLTPDMIVSQAMVVFNSLQKQFAIAQPRLALAGLNPHAGENGHIGTEELTLMQPALEALRAKGIAIDGPLPSDTLFSSGMRQKYDAILCAYHDQALIPVKTLDLDRTVNVTLGLPIIRTSPDHGTAHDIAGKGIARPDSMIEAVRLAARMVHNRG
jgi:4-hydroxythreonine-4-phosphate dehydrogenase